MTKSCMQPKRDENFSSQQCRIIEQGRQLNLHYLKYRRYIKVKTTKSGEM